MAIFQASDRANWRVRRRLASSPITPSPTRGPRRRVPIPDRAEVIDHGSAANWSGDQIEADGGIASVRALLVRSFRTQAELPPPAWENRLAPGCPVPGTAADDGAEGFGSGESTDRPVEASEESVHEGVQVAPMPGSELLKYIGMRDVAMTS